MSDAAKALARPAFGVEGLLEKGSKSFFERLFTTRHMGRVIDFFLFEAAGFLDRTPNSTELEKRIRSSFEMLVFASWAYFRKNEVSKWIELEVGWDKGKFVLSVVSYIETGLKGIFPNDETQPNTEAARAIRAFLSEVQKFSNGLMVRYHPKSGRVQFIVIFLPNLAGNFKTEYLDLTEASSEQIALLTPMRDAPTALAAARLPQFLASEAEAGTPKDLPPPAEPEDTFAAEIAKISEDLVRIRGRAQKEDGDEKTVGGGDKKNADIMRIQGSKEHIKDEIIRVKGFGVGKEKGTKVGGGSSSVDGQTTVDANGEELPAEQHSVAGGKSEQEEVDESVQLVMNAMRGDLTDVTKGMNEDEFQEMYRKIAENVRENYSQTLHHLLRMRSISAVSKVKALKTELDEAQQKIAQLQQDPVLEAAAKPVKASVLSKEIEGQDGKFQDVVSKFKGAVETGKIPAAAQEWAKGFMEEMLKERGQFNDRVREVERFLRKKEHDYKVQVTSFQEQLRLKEEDVKQREFALKKTKESLSAAMATLERIKSQTQSKSDQASLNHKLYTAEKLLAVAKENNERITKRLEESQARWNAEFSSRSAAQQDLSKANRQIEELKKQVSQADPSKTAADTAARIQNFKDSEANNKLVETLKKQNKELQSKLTAATNKGAASAAAAAKNKGGSSEADVSQLKFKLEHSNKVIKSMKDELDRYKKRFDELKLAETKLKVEVSKLQSQVKTSSAKPMVAGSAPTQGGPKAGGTKPGFGKPPLRKPGGGGTGSGTGSGPGSSS